MLPARINCRLSFCGTGGNGMQKFMLLIAIVLGIGTFAPSAAGRRTAK